MKQEFKTHVYTAKYNQEEEIWHVYRANYQCAVIYDDSREIRFTDTTVTHHISELTELRELINVINQQYEKLNP